MPDPIGAIVKANLPETRPSGVEQARPRPVVIVGVPELVAGQKYPGLIVVPFSSKVHKYGAYDRALYPIVAEGVGGLTTASVALCPQVRFIGRERLGSYLGHLPSDELEQIRATLRTMFHL
jgi:mRNA interferase MazF